jgi:hypothetical protein
MGSLYCRQPYLESKHRQLTTQYYNEAVTSGVSHTKKLEFIEKIDSMWKEKVLNK